MLSPSKASEIAKESGILRPHVYEVLKELHKRGFVDISKGKPLYFKAVDPKKAISVLKDRYVEVASEVIAKLRNYRKLREEEWLPVLCTQGEWNVRRYLEELVSRAQKELLVAVMASKPALKF